MYSHNLNRTVFVEPLENGADHLYIISAYATPTKTAWLMKLIKDLNKQAGITLLVGMTGSQGMSTTDHEGFKALKSAPLPEHISSFDCSYIYQGAPVHTKLYIWTSAGQPLCAFAGSANFTQTAFSNRQREILVSCDPATAFEYYNSLIGDSVYCNHAEVEEMITVLPPNDVDTAGERVTLSLITRRTGDVGATSGLNWGQREGRNPNQAYIPVPASVARTLFFPSDETVFTVLTDDRKQLLMRIEQQNDKAITTPLSNALLGEYFRNRLGLGEGVRVSRDDLLRYGRTDVEFIKIDDELFYMDFSV